MRSSLLLLAGMVLLVAGVAVLASDLPVRWWVGITLVVVGVAVKVGGFLMTDDPVRAPRPHGRRVTTLDGRIVEAPRAGVPAGRAAAFRRTAAVRRATASRPPSAPSLPAPPTRRAS